MALTSIADTQKTADAASGVIPIQPKTIDAQGFMKIFLAGFKNQNPLSPQDSSKILEQTAQINQIASNADLKKTLQNFSDVMSVSLGREQTMQATQLIGHQVELPAKASWLNANEKGMVGSVLVENPATNITVQIKDDQGKVLKTLHLGDTSSGGLVDFKWDGTGDSVNGEPPPVYKEGVYFMEATANFKGVSTPKAVQTLGAFTVASVGQNSDGTVNLNLNGGIGSVPMKSIIKFL